MGIYVNPDHTEFRRTLASKIYVDKSQLISRMNELVGTDDCFVCVSRPRRFGKSMAANMLTAYYSRGCESEELFAGLKAAQEGKEISAGEMDNETKRLEAYKANLNHHNVIRFDVQRFITLKNDLKTFVNEIQSAIVEELLEEFPNCEGVHVDSRLNVALDKIFNQTKTGFIFIVDEWDCVFRFAKENVDVQKEYLEFLRGIFKGARYVELAYMTGILPIKKYGEHSALNIFDEYSMTDPKNLGEYFGFTREEVQEQCVKHGVDYDEMEKWYDGYLLGNIHIYNPKSVVDALRWKEFQSYWTGTETYEALKVHIEQNFDGLKEAVVEMLGNGRCKVNSQKFQNDMTTFRSRDDVLTLLIHLGYLTYDKKTSEVFIPNREIAQEFLKAVDEPGWDGLIKSLKNSMELLESTWAMDGDAVAKGIDMIHSETTSMLKYNNENSLACVIYMAYYSANVYYARPLAELPTGKGFADIVYLPLRNVECPALVVELKWNKSARGAIEQIKDKRYGEWIESYMGDILLVGVNYDRDTKKHQCVIEKWTKE